MKILAFNGSPRTNGNTRQLIDICLKPLQEKGYDTEIIQVGGTLLHGCSACLSCRKTGQCIFKDDPINEWAEKIKTADAIILASPTYYANMTSEMKAFIDRTGYILGPTGILARKVGAPIVAARRGGAINTYNTLMAFFGINSMIVPMSSYWNLGIGREKGEVRKDEEGVRTMTNLGNNMAWLLEKLHV
jgi:Multimeric flavodoxin WrbA